MNRMYEEENKNDRLHGNSFRTTIFSQTDTIVDHGAASIFNTTKHDDDTRRREGARNSRRSSPNPANIRHSEETADLLFN